MTVYERRKATPEDIELILKNLRKFSRNELMIVADMEGQGLKQAVEGSRDVWCGFADGQLGVMYGVRMVSIVSNHAYIWMLTTELVEKHWVTFVRVCALFLEELLGQYDRLSVIAPLRSDMSQRWLQYIGFKQTGVTRMYGVKFKTYELTKEALSNEKLTWLRGDEGWQPLLAS
jgi:hypothetical protein